jgi:hypothetical protein
MLVQQALQGGNQFGSGTGFADEALRAQEAYGRFGFGGALLHGQEENFRCGSDAAYLKGRRDAIHHRHVDVEKHQLRVQSFHLVDCLLAVFGFAADGEGVCVQELAHRVARDVMVINQQDSGRKAPRRANSNDCNGMVSSLGCAILYSNDCRVFKSEQIPLFCGVSFCS